MVRVLNFERPHNTVADERRTRATLRLVDLRSCMWDGHGSTSGTAPPRPSSRLQCARKRVLHRQPTGPNPVNHRDDLIGPALRHGSLNPLCQCATLAVNNSKSRRFPANNFTSRRFGTSVVDGVNFGKVDGVNFGNVDRQVVSAELQGYLAHEKPPPPLEPP